MGAPAVLAVAVLVALLLVADAQVDLGKVTIKVHPACKANIHEVIPDLRSIFGGTEWAY